MTQPPQQLLSSLSEEEWVDLYNRLRLFTYVRYGRLGLDLEEVVHRSIVDTLLGNKRLPSVSWQSGESDPKLSLFLSLCFVIRSNVAHQWEFERRGAKTHTQELDLDMEQLLLDEPGGSQNLGKRRAALLGNQGSKSKAHRNDIKEKIQEALADNQEVAIVVNLWANGYSPKEIASQTGLSLPKIFQILKQFQKKLIRSQEEFVNG
jgi:hypothetical protein